MSGKVDAMATIVLNKRLGRKPAGATVPMGAGHARVLVALGHAYYAPAFMPKIPAPVPKSAQVEEAKPKRQYTRRDMVAEAAPEPAANVNPWKAGDV
jgi:hypothetical protein